VAGSDSPIVEVLLRMSDSFGKVREGLATAGKERWAHKQRGFPLSGRPPAKTDMQSGFEIQRPGGHKLPVVHLFRTMASEAGKPTGFFVVPPDVDE